MQSLNRREQMQALLAVIGLSLVGFALFYGGSAAAVPPHGHQPSAGNPPPPRLQPQNWC